MRNKYTYKDVEKYKDRRICGKIIDYNHVKGYGFIKTEDGKDIFISSYNLIRKNSEKKIFFGTKVDFNLDMYGKKVIATNIKILESENIEYKITEDLAFHSKDILKAGFSNSYKEIIANAKKNNDFKFIEELTNNFNEKEFLYIYIVDKKNKEYRFYNKDSSVPNVIKTDLNELQKLLGI